MWSDGIRALLTCGYGMKTATHGTDEGQSRVKGIRLTVQPQTARAAEMETEKPFQLPLFVSFGDRLPLGPRTQSLSHGCSMHGMPFHLQQWPRPFLVATRGKSIAEGRVGGSSKEQIWHLFLWQSTPFQLVSLGWRPMIVATSHRKAPAVLRNHCWAVGREGGRGRRSFSLAAHRRCEGATVDFSSRKTSILEERVPLFGASTSGQQVSRTVDEHHQAREEMENQREGSTEVHVRVFTVCDVVHVVLLTTGNPLAVWECMLNV